MAPELLRSLRTLLLDQDVATLATRHKDDPAASMVPYVVLPDSGDIVIHVSRLATHTRDMLEHPAVSLLVIADRTPEVMAQARARAALAGDARVCPADAPEHAAARRAYLERFPDSEPMFGFGDFSLFLVSPRAVRWVPGFAQAGSLTRAQYLALMAGGDGAPPA